MIKLFNQSIGGLGLTKAKSFIRDAFLPSPKARAVVGGDRSGEKAR